MASGKVSSWASAGRMEVEVVGVSTSPSTVTSFSEARSAEVDRSGLASQGSQGYLLLGAEAAAVGLLAPLGATLRFVLSNQAGSLSLDRAGYWSLLSVFQQQAYLLPNLLGCCAMGVLVAEQRQQRHQHQHTLRRATQERERGKTQTQTETRPDLLLVALNTGFCGSLTSYSAWAGSQFAQRADLLYAQLVSFSMVFALSWACFLLGFALWRAGHVLIGQSQGMRGGAYAYGAAAMGEQTSEVGASSRREKECAGAARAADVEAANSHALSGGEKGGERKGGKVGAWDAGIICNSSARGSGWAGRGSTERWEQWTWVALFVTFLAVVWAVVLADVGAYSIQNDMVRCGLRSAALAPAGALGRWGLRRGMLQWGVPTRRAYLSTLLSNCLGVLLFTLLLAHGQDWSWNEPLRSGVAGSLSTVSSLLAELKVLYEGGDAEAAQSSRSDASNTVNTGDTDNTVTTGDAGGGTMSRKDLGVLFAARYLLATVALTLLLSQTVRGLS
ncbi:hypothetical protein B484DRAFT_447377 [Ochromonadaceae sp. CCMP2298]|nr:hypothetical protein B484DRAFT_447377 [Ochromonadaceae sp. CCMP2298]